MTPREKTMLGQIAALEREVVELREYARDATRAITALTTGGSEFFGKRIGNIYTADLRRCKQNIQALHGHTHDQLVSTRRAMKAERAECVEVLREFVAFFDKAMLGFSDGWAERRAESRTPMFRVNDSDLHVTPFLAARALLGKLEAKS